MHQTSDVPGAGEGMRDGEVTACVSKTKIKSIIEGENVMISFSPVLERSTTVSGSMTSSESECALCLSVKLSFFNVYLMLIDWF